VIKSFRDKETEQIWHGDISKKLPRNIQDTARRKLRMLNNAASINDLRIPPANRLEALKGRPKGLHSIKINRQWRVCFRWVSENAFDVEIVDYHG